MPYAITSDGDRDVLAEAGDLQGAFRAIYVLGQDQIAGFLEGFWADDGEKRIMGIPLCADGHQFAADLAKLSETYLFKDDEVSQNFLH